MQALRPVLLIGLLCLPAILPGCRLVDQTTFDPALRARLAAKPKKPDPAPASGTPALLTIRFEREEDTLPALRDAVNQALARKPDVRFNVVTVVPNTGTPDEQIEQVRKFGGDARRIAADLQDLGVDPGQVTLGARVEPGVNGHEVRIYVE